MMLGYHVDKTWKDGWTTIKFREAIDPFVNVQGSFKTYVFIDAVRSTFDSYLQSYISAGLEIPEPVEINIEDVVSGSALPIEDHIVQQIRAHNATVLAR